MLDWILTPSEDLIIDVLSARYRLAEPFWPLATKHMKQLRHLEEEGYIRTQSGNVDGTVKVFLTTEAQNDIDATDYIPAIRRHTIEEVAAYVRGVDKAMGELILVQFKVKK